MRPPPADRSPAELLRFGVVNLDKPPGPSAHQVAAWVRDAVDGAVREFDPDGGGIDDAAHAGTLDPKVTGCLPTLTGTATRAARALQGAAKEYVAVLELHAPAPPDLGEVLTEFEGPIYQKPPRKSAVRRDLRVREVYELDALEVERRRALLRVRCESGTYVRKLCHDLGLALGTGAHMGDLRRTATGPFDDADLVTLHDLADAIAWAREGDAGALRDVVRPAEAALAGLPRVEIAASAAEEVANGAPVYAPGVLSVSEGARPGGDGSTAAEPPLAACFTPGATAVCLGRVVGDPDASSGVVVELERVLV